MVEFKRKTPGIIIALTMVFGSIFLLLLSGLLGYILLQLKLSRQKVVWENSLQMAEAGNNYYRWHLNHNPADAQDGQAFCCATPPCSACGPYIHDFYDFQGNLVGSFSLEITAKKICDEILGMQIFTIGSSEQFPDIKRKVRTKYASTSVAEYSYLLDESVWAGQDRQIFGRYHSNKGIRMDGSHNSLVTSSVSNWLCTSSFGCDSQNCPPGCVKQGNACSCPGIFGTGGPADFWKYPVSPFDFIGLTSDLAKIKGLAATKGKYFFPSVNNNPQGKGYHLVLKPDGTFDLRIITSLGRVRGYSLEEGWHWDYHLIQTEVPYQSNISLPSNCGLIFTEDDLWIEGSAKGRITVASANLIDQAKDTGVVINGNLNYTSLSGEDSLAVLTEKDILIPLYSPTDMNLMGVFVSQKGRSISRNHYDCQSYPLDCKKNNLTLYGSVVSKGRVGTKWVYTDNSWASGYNNRYDYFDQKLALDPPPLLPYVSEDLQLISWEEVQ